MARFVKRVVADGHVTVPSDLRTALDISPGDIVEFEIVGITRRARDGHAHPANAPAATPSHPDHS